ncbi:Autophagy-related protein 1010 family protein [Nannochloropsis gaditana]|uniref:Autophagy-related protein 101 n=1 Tax=Nannochloropsis gaditana TaxID=72520 RepID=W7TZD9_9STRA|nr:Autophagy-related protein 1010 family protein [Nannochloropsis gaditana]
MNHKEHVLGELELRPLHTKEALQCLLHSIIFLRAPNIVRPREVHCRHLRLSYPKVERPTSSSSSSSPFSVARIDEVVDSALDACLRNLTPAGPNLSRGHLVLTFYERRQTLSFFRLIQNEERVVFEEWIIPFLVDSMGSTSTLASSLSASDDGFVGVHDGELYTEPSSHSSMSTLPPASLYGGGGEDPAIAVEQQRAQARTEALLRSRLQDIYTLVNGSIDHIPPVSYLFQV